MIIDKNSNTTTSTKKSDTKSIESADVEKPLDEQTIADNLAKLAMKGKKGKSVFMICIFYKWLHTLSQIKKYPFAIL